MDQSSLYHYVVVIAEDYFGPAANRVVERLAIHHLDKSPEELTPNDLPELITWSKLAIALVTNDQTVIEEFSSRLEKLQQSPLLEQSNRS